MHARYSQRVQKRWILISAFSVACLLSFALGLAHSALLQQIGLVAALFFAVAAILTHAVTDGGPSQRELGLAGEIWQLEGFDCLECHGAGQVPNYELKAFEPCSVCNPQPEPAQPFSAGPRGRRSALAG